MISHDIFFSLHVRAMTKSSLYFLADTTILIVPGIDIIILNHIDFAIVLYFFLSYDDIIYFSKIMRIRVFFRYNIILFHQSGNIGLINPIGNNNPSINSLRCHFLSHFYSVKDASVGESIKSSI